MKAKDYIVVLGGGESGVGAALLAASRGYDVFLSDSGKIDPGRKKTLDDAEIPFEEGGHSLQTLRKATLVVKSPGIPGTAPVVKALKESGTPVISEIEWASRFTGKPIIAITGSNGKSTTTALTHHIFQRAGWRAALGGNIGVAFSKLVASDEYDVYIIEVSSFQLDDCYHFKPHIAILLNITPDHLDRYGGSFEAYINSKFKITANQTPDDYFIYSFDDPVIAKHLPLHAVQATRIPFSLQTGLSTGAYVNSNQFIINYKQKPMTMTIDELSLRGKHNLYNSMAAGIAARIFDIRNEVIRESLMNFQGLEHRLEHVLTIGGVEFINDSKATNVNSTWYALESMDKPVIWIAGGVDKGNDYSVLQPLVKSKVKAIVCLGKNNLKIHHAFSRYVDLIVNTSTMDAAVKTAYHLAEKGDVVLLSPACASFDLFENYQERGWAFKKAVRNL